MIGSERPTREAIFKPFERNGSDGHGVTAVTEEARARNSF